GACRHRQAGRAGRGRQPGVRAARRRQHPGRGRGRGGGRRGRGRRPCQEDRRSRTYRPRVRAGRHVGTDAPQSVVRRDTELMARAAAARLITHIVDAQSARGTASVVLTGGRNGNALLKAIAESPARDAVDWAHLDLWWGDERFLPERDGERNATQARSALL